MEEEPVGSCGDAAYAAYQRILVETSAAQSERVARRRRSPNAQRGRMESPGPEGSEGSRANGCGTTDRRRRIRGLGSRGVDHSAPSLADRRSRTELQDLRGLAGMGVRGFRKPPLKRRNVTMGRPKSSQSIYWRERGGTRRAYADLRDYADVGGGREALVAPGEKVATADETTAHVLLARRLEQLDATRRG